MRKKITATLGLILCLVGMAVAQPRAVGIRLGGSMELAYQHSLGNNMLDVSAGLGLGSGYFFTGATAVYDWLFPINSWKHAGEWTFYAGPGAGAGVGFDGYSAFMTLHVGGQVGIEYAFNIPLNLSIDYRPMINLLGFHNNYWGFWSGLAVGVKYRF